MNQISAEAGAPQPFCSVIILNYNGRPFLDVCLRSVLAQEYGEFEVILVDNGSDDGSAEFVREAFPAVMVMETGRNLGYAGGNNAAVAVARGEWIVLLNNDTHVRPGWLAALSSAAVPRDVAIVSSLVITRGIPDSFYERNGSINFLCHNIMRVFHRPENIFYGGGASMLFKRDLLGIPFDGEYFAYLEDVYLGLRARFMGYRVVHTNASVVEHFGSGTSAKQKNGLFSYLQERNRIMNVVLFFSGWTLVRISPFILLNVPAKIVLGIVSPRHSWKGFVRAYWWLCTHLPAILGKRHVLRSEQQVSEREVLSWMTGRLTDGESFAGKCINRCALGYCRIVGIRTIETLPAGTR